MTVSTTHAPGVVDVKILAVIPGEAPLLGVGNAVTEIAVFRRGRIDQIQNDLTILIEQPFII
jgi:hypothetical protein